MDATPIEVWRTNKSASREDWAGRIAPCQRGLCGKKASAINSVNETIYSLPGLLGEWNHSAMLASRIGMV
jgi:hypothetical protein